MPDRVLPAGLLELGVVREAAGDVGVDLAQGHPLHDAVLDGHGDEGHVGVGRPRGGRLGSGGGGRRGGLCRGGAREGRGGDGHRGGWC